MASHAAPKITVTKMESVYPKTKHPQTILNLSNLDRQCPVLMYLVFFYSNPLKLPLKTVFQSLKSGLEETLSVWFPAAGRLWLNPKGKMNLWCNNEGAILVEAVTEKKISELGDLSQYNDFFENLVFKPLFNGNFSDMPLVVAQVTRFGCGGYSVGIGTSHSLFDGPAAFDFLRSWAFASNNSQINLKENGQNQKPVLERDILMVRINHAQKVKIRAAAIDHLYQLIQAKAAAEPNLGANNGEIKCVFKTFHLSGQMIENLKNKTLCHGRGSFSCSSFEVLTAHLWKARTKALGVKKETMVCLQFAVDIRTKMVPPLPEHFSGNAYVLASVSLLASELEERRYEVVIEKIRHAKNSVNEDYVYAYMEALDGPPRGALPPIKELTMVSDWTRMPFHKVDFLCGDGDATYVSPLVSPVPQVAYLMQNPIDLRGINIRVGLPPEVLDAFSYYFLMNMIST